MVILVPGWMSGTSNSDTIIVTITYVLIVLYYHMHVFLLVHFISTVNTCSGSDLEWPY